MEDHKRKNKKKSQNKRPTQEQIKKIQTNVEQRKETKTNGVTPVQADPATGSLKREAKAPNEIQVQIEHHANGIGREKKSKKKNKQNRKQNESESENTNANGHIEEENKTQVDLVEKVVIVKEAVEGTQIHAETVAAVIENITQSNGNGTCSQVDAGASNCLQHHTDEAPTCSHHIQHHLNNVKVADFKIDFDIQKHLSPVGTQFGSNQEYFYKGFTVENMADKINNGLGESEDSSVNPEEIVKALLGNREAAPPNPDEMLKSMFRNPTSPPFNPQELMKNMFGNQEKQAGNSNPDDLLKSMFGNQGTKQAGPSNPADVLKAMLGKDENQVPPFNPQEMMKSMFGNQGKQQAGPSNPADMLKGHQAPPFNPAEMMKSMFGNQGAAPFNPEEMMKNMFGNGPSQETPDPDLNVNVEDMFGQMNAMAQHIDPNVMNNMSQMVANMDPAILSEVNNMAMSLMQGGGIQDSIQKLMQMKANRVKNNASKIVEMNHTEESVELKNNNSELVGNERGNNEQSSNQREDKKDKHDQGNENETEKKEINEISNKFEGESKDVKEDGENVKSGKDKTSDDSNNGADTTSESFMKPSFSFSSNTSEKSEEDKIEDEGKKENDNSEEETEVVTRKTKRFERELSIPELIENLTKVDLKKEETKKEEERIKRNKLKAIFSKVLKKEKKIVEGSECISSSIEFHEHRIEYQTGKQPTKNKSQETKEIDYEKLQHVKEPLEVSGKRETSGSKEITPQQSAVPVKNIKEILKNKEANTNETGETSQQKLSFTQELDKKNLDDYVEINPDNMNEMFQNLLQGKHRSAANNGPSEPVGSNQSINNNPLASLLNNMTNLFETSGFNKDQILNLTGVEGNGPDIMSSMFSNLLQSDSSKGESSKTNDVSNTESAGKSASLESVMSQMFVGMQTMSSGGNSDLSEAISPTGNPDNFLQNFQRTLMRQFNNNNEENGSDTPNVNLLQNMIEMFDKVMPNEDGNSVPDMNTLMGKPENFANILQMGEMLFGKSPLNLAPNIDNSSENSKLEEGESQENVLNTDKNSEEEEVIEETTTISKNIYQEERTSVLLKKLLGEKFWSIRKKRNDLIPEENLKLKPVKSKSEKKKSVTSSSETSIDKDLSKDPANSIPFDITSFSMENQSPFVKMIQRKIQKDPKLQQFLKEKLRKDPKMQQIIAERMQKDERLQTFIREKLSKDKEMRKTFREKFKNELGLTNIIPKFEDDDEDNINGDIAKETNDEDKNSTQEQHQDIKRNTKKEDKDENNKKRYTIQLIKKYMELTVIMCGIITMGIICY
ncbi:uncharacterized protein PF11_0213 [Diaphorina citri]|jgi:hypothetical protein|uniref:Uncharacterized protein PF11_0213 n=1 Tax=Diaphorina citri TaxID=121845 RepID=A0A1S3CZA6_DIACI|nr:uncharacterized protein PF11_0213 [Diaphorina citri]